MSSMTKEEKKFVRYALAERSSSLALKAGMYILDGYSAFQAAGLLEEEILQNLDTLRLMLAAMTVSYGRPFTENNGIGTIPVDEISNIFDGDKGAKGAHDKIMEMRHKFHAHTDVEGSGLKLVKNNEKSLGWVAAVRSRDFIHPEYVSYLMKAPRKVQNYCSKKIEERIAFEKRVPDENGEIVIFDNGGNFKWKR